MNTCLNNWLSNNIIYILIPFYETLQFSNFYKYIFIYVYIYIILMSYALVERTKYLESASEIKVLERRFSFIKNCILIMILLVGHEFQI